MTTFRSGGWALPERRARAAAGAVAQSVPPATAIPAAPVLRRNTSLVNASLSAICPPLSRMPEGRGAARPLPARGYETAASRASVEVVRVEPRVVDALAGVDATEVLGERTRRRVDVQEARPADAREPMQDPRRNDDCRSGLRANRLVVDAEVELAFEDVEAVCMPQVHVWRSAVVL